MRTRGEMTEDVRALLAQGVDPKTIAGALGTTRAYVYLVRWRLAHPDYSPEWMRKARRHDGYRRRELRQQKILRQREKGTNHEHF